MTNTRPPVQIATGRDHMVVSAELPNLSPADAFSACTTPELITRWWPDQAAIDPQPGGKYRLSWPAMNWELFGQFTELEPGKRLAYTWNWAHQPELPTRLVAIDFEPQVSGTLLTVHHERYGDSAVEREDRQSHIDGWIYFLGRLQALGKIDT